MSDFSRSELEDAYAHYLATCERAAGDWNWNLYAEMFTPDAHYVETHFGEFHGREEIRKWIVGTMDTPPYDEMRLYPHEWVSIDEANGWVICSIWNQMTDPGDGREYKEINWSKCVYAGGNQWSFQEDIYNPVRFGKMIRQWSDAKSRAAS